MLRKQERMKFFIPVKHIYFITFKNINKHRKKTDPCLHAYVSISSAGLSTSRLGFTSLFWMIYPYKNPTKNSFLSIINKDLLFMTDTNLCNFLVIIDQLHLSTDYITAQNDALFRLKAWLENNWFIHMHQNKNR